MDREDRKRDNLENLEFLLRDIQISPDIEEADILKPEKPEESQDFF
jgi:hypothetical protein